MEKRKINQIYLETPKRYENKLYKDNYLQFNYFLNSTNSGSNDSEPYFENIETQEKLNRIIKTYNDCLSFFISDIGTGKTVDIIHTFECVGNGIVLNKENHTIIIPQFYHGYIAEDYDDIEDNEILSPSIDNIAKSIFAACRKIDEEYPKVHKWFNEPKTKELFKVLIQKTNPKLFEYPDTEDINDKQLLEIAKIRDFFIYSISKLKLYLLFAPCGINRALFILDGVESLDIKSQKLIVSKYLHLFKCMQNYSKWDKARRIYINMLISIRPETKDMLSSKGILNGFEDINQIYKSNDIDMAEYFRQKNKNIPKEIRNINSEKWDKALKTLLTLSEKFDGKYSKMILRLSGNNLRKALSVYTSILSNEVWVTKDAQTDPSLVDSIDEYIFNNITIYRAIACHNDLVYRGDSTSLIPNIIYSVNKKNYVLPVFYLLKYFYNLHIMSYSNDYEFYTEEYILHDFNGIFSEDILNNDFDGKLINILNYLVSLDIIKSLSGGYSITSKGIELWNMFQADSVLIEMYREDFYMDYDSPKSNKFDSSYQLMQDRKQDVIFTKLLELLNNLYKKEKDIIKKVKQHESLQQYFDRLGNESVVQHLFRGLCNSIDFSGKYNNSDVQYEREKLQKLIDTIFD